MTCQIAELHRALKKAIIELPKAVIHLQGLSNWHF